MTTRNIRRGLAAIAALNLLAGGLYLVHRASNGTSIAVGTVTGRGRPFGSDDDLSPGDDGDNTLTNADGGSDWVGGLATTSTTANLTDGDPSPTDTTDTTDGSHEPTTTTTVQPRPAPPSPDYPNDAVSFQLDNGHTGGRDDPSLPDNLHVLWSKEVGGQLGYSLIVGDKVFVSDAGLHAYDRETGAEIWSGAGGGELAYDHGHLFAKDEGAGVQSFDAKTGALQWSFEVQSSRPDIGGWGSGPAVAADGIVYVPYGPDLAAVDERDGSLLWQAMVNWGGAVFMPALSGYSVYAVTGCTYPFAYDTETGANLWNTPRECAIGESRNAPAFYNGHLYTRYYPADGHDFVYDTSGNEVRGFRSDNAPAFHGNVGYYMAAGSLEAHNLSTGALLWSNAGMGTSEMPPLAVGDRVFAVDASGVLHAYDGGTGNELGSFATGGTFDVFRDNPGFEYAFPPIIGMTEARGVLIVSVGTKLIAFG